ncbi:MAG: hypothetical protein R6V07_15965 [Armatimonadota bacterium]
MHERASRHRLAVTLLCAALLMLAGHGALATPQWSGFVFDVTVTYEPGGSYIYSYDLEIADNLSSNLDAFWLEGAYGVDLATISHTDTDKYSWNPGEVIKPGERPSWDTNPVYTDGDTDIYKYTNIGTMPAIVWGKASIGTDPKLPGLAGSFSFHSDNPPHTREWYVSGCGGEGDSGLTTGPTPGLSPILLLLGQGVPILGWIGYKRRRHA